MAGAVWLRTARTHRDAPLTLDRIVAAAVDLLDAEGTGRLTMRRLAERLEVATPTLYWHVKTKDDVLDLALDAIFAEVAVPTAKDWTDAVRALVLDWRAAMLPGANLVAATHGLANFTIGSALTEATWPRAELQGAAEAHVRAHADTYPTPATNDHLASPDWDALFSRGLDHFLAGLAGSL